MLKVWIFIFCDLLSINALAQDRIPLTNDLSRDQLALYAQNLHGGIRAFPTVFRFPDDTRAGDVFGIDVSHYQGGIDWQRVVGQNVQFAFVKATQGDRSYDPKFDSNWSALDKVKTLIRRGAYHFLTANDSAELQADNFIKTIGVLAPADLPPCVDVEWDFLIKNGKPVLDAKGGKIDQWVNLSRTEIVNKLNVWLTKVEAETHRRPIIYTNSIWWNSRIGVSPEFSGYKIWVADYTNKSLGREAPNSPKNLEWSLWQMTDRGSIKAAGLTKGIDATIVRQADLSLFNNAGQ